MTAETEAEEQEAPYFRSAKFMQTKEYISYLKEQQQNKEKQREKGCN